MKVKGLILDKLKVEIAKKNYYSSVAYYGWLYEGGKITAASNTYCHAGLNTSESNKGLIAVWTQMQKPAFGVNEADRTMFINYMLHESPWSHIFLNETPEEVYTYGWLIDANADAHLVVNAAVATRTITEYADTRFVFFIEAVKNGMSKPMAMVLSQYMYPSENTFYISPSSGHGFVYDINDKIIDRFINNKPILKSPPYNSRMQYIRHCDVWDGVAGYSNKLNVTNVLRKIPVYKHVEKVNLNIFYKDKKAGNYTYHTFASAKYFEEKVKELLVA